MTGFGKVKHEAVRRLRIRQFVNKRQRLRQIQSSRHVETTLNHSALSLLLWCGAFMPMRERTTPSGSMQVRNGRPGAVQISARK
jgi:hypothetical protein